MLLLVSITLIGKPRATMLRPASDLNATGTLQTLWLFGKEPEIIDRLVEGTDEPTSDNLRRAGLFAVTCDEDSIRRRRVTTHEARNSESNLELCAELTG